jgi:hypothetical protein
MTPVRPKDDLKERVVTEMVLSDALARLRDLCQIESIVADDRQKNLIVLEQATMRKSLV